MSHMHGESLAKSGIDSLRQKKNILQLQQRQFRSVAPPNDMIVNEKFA